MAKILREIKNEAGHVVQTQEEEVPSVQVTKVAPETTDVDVDVNATGSTPSSQVNVKDTVPSSSTVTATKKTKKA